MNKAIPGQHELNQSMQESGTMTRYEEKEMFAKNLFFGHDRLGLEMRKCSADLITDVLVYGRHEYFCEKD